MDGIVIGRSTTSNAIRVYNPRNKQYYEPDSYSIDPFRLSVSVYPTITYDGGLFCSLYRDTTPSFDEPYPPGTCVERVDPHTEILKSGTVMDISLPSSPSQSEYLIQFDNSTTATISLSDMPDLILTPPAPSSDDDSSPLLQLFLQLNSKITYEHEGQYYKGYLGKSDNGYRIVYKRHPNACKEEWGVAHPDLPYNWTDLCVQRGPSFWTSSFLIPLHSLYG
jgi:hypothetical protein